RRGLDYELVDRPATIAASRRERGIPVGSGVKRCQTELGRTEDVRPKRRLDCSSPRTPARKHPRTAPRRSTGRIRGCARARSREQWAGKRLQQIVCRLSIFDRFAEAASEFASHAAFFIGCALLVVFWLPSYFLIGDLNGS